MLSANAVDNLIKIGNYKLEMEITKINSKCEEHGLIYYGKMTGLG